MPLAVLLTTRGGTCDSMSRPTTESCGTVRWMPTSAMSLTWAAPHMFRQHAMAMRSLLGRSSRWKYSNRSSMTALVMPEASVAGVWQCTQPCVCTTLLMEAPVPPTGSPWASHSAMSGSTFCSSDTKNSMLLRLVKRR